MRNKNIDTLNITYFHKYNMSFDLIASFIQQKMNISHLSLHHYSDFKSLLAAVEKNNIDIIIINSSCLFDDNFLRADIKKVLATLCENENIITIFFAQNMTSALLKKIIDTGMDIVISAQDTPQELITAVRSVIMQPARKNYISACLQKHMQQEHADLTPTEWEIMNLIKKGYTPSEIASKKCRALSTISTQKRNAMNKLRLRNENELLCFLQQNAFF